MSETAAMAERKGNGDMGCLPKSIDVINHEIGVVRKMIQDERWYEGERRHREVTEKEIESRINELVLSHGGKMRQETVEELRRTMCDRVGKVCENCPYFSPGTEKNDEEP